MGYRRGGMDDGDGVSVEVKRDCRDGKNIAPIQLGREFDASFDVNPAAPETVPQMAEPVGFPRQQRARPGSSRIPRPNQSQHSSGCTGTTATRDDDSELSWTRAQNQAPVAMVKYSRDDDSSRSVMSDAPSPSVRVYYFGWRQELGYIPKPFISSHRQKIAPDRPVTARNASWKRQYEVPVKLSRRRRLDRADRNFQHSIVVGSFDQFEKMYRGP
jgi:hypothetical protein